MRMLNVHQAKTQLSAALAAVERDGEVFLICRNGKPVAKLIPHRQRDRLAPHPLMQRIEVRYDPVEDLTDDEWSQVE